MLFGYFFESAAILKTVLWLQRECFPATCCAGPALRSISSGSRRHRPRHSTAAAAALHGPGAALGGAVRSGRARSLGGRRFEISRPLNQKWRSLITEQS